MPFPTTSVLDTFTRADDLVGAGNSNWAVSRNSGLYIYTNEAGPFSAAISQANSWAASFPANQEVFYTLRGSVPNPGFWTMCYVRLQTSTNLDADCYYLLTFTTTGTNNDEQSLWSQVSLVNTQLGATINLGVDTALGDQFGMSASGTTITAYRNGTSTGSRTDSAIAAAGYIGLQTQANSGAVRMDDFGGGAIAIPSFVARPSTYMRARLVR
jgi:hypothetical protein